MLIFFIFIRLGLSPSRFPSSLIMASTTATSTTCWQVSPPLTYAYRHNQYVLDWHYGLTVSQICWSPQCVDDHKSSFFTFLFEFQRVSWTKARASWRWPIHGLVWPTDLQFAKSDMLTDWLKLKLWYHSWVLFQSYIVYSQWTVSSTITCTVCRLCWCTRTQTQTMWSWCMYALFLLFVQQNVVWEMFSWACLNCTSAYKTCHKMEVNTETNQKSLLQDFTYINFFVWFFCLYIS